MVDLKGQYENIKPEINQAILDVIESTAFINGPQVKSFAQELAAFLNVKHVIPCANGTDALQIALMALGLKPGDEVITPNFTFIATIEVIALLGLVPVLVDVNPNTFNIDPSEIEKAITPRTKAIIPVHLFGQSSEMERIISIAAEKDIFVVEDNAQALGAEYTFKNGRKSMAGTMGHIGCTSFFPSKNLGTYGDGGAIFTNNDQLAESMRMITNHGSKVKYYHETIGVNSRLDTLHAAILNIKLKHLNDYNASRQKVAMYYDKELGAISGLQIPTRSADFSTHIFHQYTLIVKDRNELKEYLHSKGIPAMVYYPVAFHHQKAFSHFSQRQNSFPVTEYLCKHVISLPMHTEMDAEQLQYITSTIKTFF